MRRTAPTYSMCAVRGTADPAPHACASSMKRGIAWAMAERYATARSWSCCLPLYTLQSLLLRALSMLRKQDLGTPPFLSLFTPLTHPTPSFLSSCRHPRSAGGLGVKYKTGWTSSESGARSTPCTPVPLLMSA